jgi:mono/diheme cytochrome c family protein
MHSLRVAALLSILLLSTSGEVFAQSKLRNAVLNEGREDFAENCAACHGADATGKGELAQKLLKPPKDLTLIAKSQGGRFPFWHVFDIIAGDVPVPGHDTFHMPDYSQRMRGQEQAPGFPPAHVRVLELTHYLESIQQK